MNISSQRNTLLLFAGLLLFFSIGLGARPYLVPSEARYIEIPRQMLATGDWLTPRINGVPYFEKPPLFYWMQASVMQFFGSGEFAGRFVTMLLTALTCVVTYITGHMLYGRRAGLLAALVLATCTLGYGLSRVAMLDMPVSFFLTACIACFIAAQRGHRRFYYGMYAAAALATMSKGLIGIVIPGLVIGAWIMVAKRWYILKEARLLTGFLLFLLIVAPWHLLMARAHPEFNDFYFIHEHFTRFVSDEHKRSAPWWFFLAITPIGLLPWVFFLPAAWKRLSRKEPVALFLMLWILLPLFFFSASHSKLVPYIFPIFPPLAVVVGQYLATRWEEKRTLILALAGSMAMLGIIANYAVPMFDKSSVRPLVGLLQQRAQADDIIATYDGYFQDLPVYLDRDVTIVRWRGELNFGYEHYPETQALMISPETFQKRCAAAKHGVFVLMRKNTWENLAPSKSCRLQMIAEYGKTVLVEKQ